MDKGDQFDRDSTQPIRGPKKDRLRPAVNIWTPGGYLCTLGDEMGKKVYIPS